MKRPWIGAAADVRREEWPFAATMSGAFFLVITSFWILKPLKKAHFIQFYDETSFSILGFDLEAAQAELIAKVLNMVVAAFAAALFSVASGHLRRERLLIAFALLFVLGHGAFAFALADLSGTTVWTFYLYGDLFSTLMVVSFFAFLNDTVSQDAAKRLYGLAGLGGVAGGAVGSFFLASWIDDLDSPQWMVVCAVLGVSIAAAGLAAGRFARRLPADSRSSEDDGEDEEKDEVSEEGGAIATAFAGAGLAMRSRYLLSVIAIVALYELVSTLMDFQFSSSVEHFLDGDAIGEHFSLVYAITNGLALFVQLFVTSFVMTRLGVGVALLVLPVAVACGSSAFLLIPTLWTGSLLSTADNAFAYSINQSAKESLYVPTTPAEKYQAKAFIDMWVQRFAKAVAVVVGLGITVTFQQFAMVRWLSLLSLALLLIWIPCVRYAGRQFEEHEKVRD
jgi:AAA family ATP:ADP antiporter